MIFPFFDGIRSWVKAPVTWSLILLNAMMMSVSVVPSKLSEKALEGKTDEPYFLLTQGRVFAQFIEQRPHQHSPFLRELAKVALEGHTEKVELLGSLALRNERFLSEGIDLDYKGDQVAIDYWRKQVLQIRELQLTHPSFVLGLNSQDMGLNKWVTYIFVHSGPVHFAGNMIFLLIFGSVLEPLIGGLALLVVFLLSGMVAAGAFLLLSGASLAPLVGASGAVSGLMSLCCWMMWRRPVAYLYFLLPMRGYSGYLYLPAWSVFVVWLMADLAGYMSAVSEIGGVAYSAHLGGETAGLLVGGVVYLARFRKADRWKDLDGSSAPKVGTMIPFIPKPDKDIFGKSA